MLMTNQAQNDRSRLVRMNKSTGPQTLPEAIITENRLNTRYRLDPLEVPATEMTLENWKRIENALHGTGCAVYDKEKKELRFLKYIGSHLSQDILSKISDEEVKTHLILYSREVNDLIRKKDEDLSETVLNQVQEDKKAQSNLNLDIEKIREGYAAKRTEANLVNQQKAKPARVYSDLEKSKGIHWQTFSEPDLQRSKDNLRAKKNEFKSSVRDLEKEIRNLDNKIIPHSQKIEGLKKLLASDLSEEQFRNTKLSIEYNESQIEKLQNKMVPLFDQTHELHQQIKEIDQQLKILGLCISACHVKKDAFINYPRRVQRLRDTIHKHIRKTAKLEDERVGLNQQWKKLTGDSQDIVPILGLKTDSAMFFI